MANDQIMTPLANIVVQPGHNPRQYFDPVALESLATTIRNVGVVQPLTIRPRGDGEKGYWIVCGERRWRAAGMAGLTEIPAYLRDYDDATALAVANIENQERENLSPAEEAQMARRAIDAAGGDKDEAGRILNWAPSRVQARLLLLNACADVQTAVNNKTIRIGHAELLATLPEDVQKRVLASVINNNATVELLRDQLGAFTQELAKAPFDTTLCKGCPNNSSTQSSLFSFHVGEGRCSNKPCWDKFRDAALEATKVELADEFPLVFFDKDKDPATHTRLEELGPRGVGTEQLNTGCKACKSYGAIISTTPGKERKVQRGTCFDLICHSEKVEAFQATLPPPAMEKTAPNKGKVAKAPAKPVDKPAAKALPAKAASPGSPVKVLREIWAFFRREGAKEAEQSQRLIDVVSLYALMHAAGKGSDTKATFKKILAMPDDEIATQIHGTALYLLRLQKEHVHNQADPWEVVGALLMKDRKVELAGRFKMDRAFIEAHTKSGLEAVLTQADFEASQDGKTPADRKKNFRKLMGQKAPQIVKAVLNSNHDFSKFVPKEVAAQFKKI